MDNKQHKVMIFEKRKHTVSSIFVLVSAGALPKRQQRHGAETEAVEGKVADSALVLLWAIRTYSGGGGAHHGGVLCH